MELSGTSPHLEAIFMRQRGKVIEILYLFRGIIERPRLLL
jgi:hypothetical protein